MDIKISLKLVGAMVEDNGSGGERVTALIY